MKANEVKFPSGPSVYKVHGEIYRYLGPMHEAHGESPKCLQTFFIDAKMQAELGNDRFGATNEKTMTSLRAILETNNSYIKSFLTIEEQLRNNTLPPSVKIELLANQQPRVEHRRRYTMRRTRNLPFF